MRHAGQLALVCAVAWACSKDGPLAADVINADEPTESAQVAPSGADPEAKVIDAGAPKQAAPAVEVVCREAWGARQPKASYRKHKIEKVTIHHQGAVFDDNRRAPSRMRSMQAYHQSAAQGFVDIAYHLVIDLNGNVYEGRPWWAVGETRTDYDPTGHLLVGLLGNFETQEPSASQIDSLVRLLGWACSEFGVDPEQIKGHQDYARTLCPGKNLEQLISSGEIRRLVEKEVSENGPATMRLVCGKEAKSRLDRIRAGQ